MRKYQEFLTAHAEAESSRRSLDRMRSSMSNGIKEKLGLDVGPIRRLIFDIIDESIETEKDRLSEYVERARKAAIGEAKNVISKVDDFA